MHEPSEEFKVAPFPGTTTHPKEPQPSLPDQCGVLAEGWCWLLRHCW